ncbi:Ger(x)C family spore germination protein [Paenibacillus sp. MER 180]|uniref:Ger(x)C family spore germination protein n=1 Tax=Paenibacillus sp. MER 180 TaxID=2939570 RepID=UPI00203F887F|nr:Ger(x)C family spore germination protein [Paenibacillus sp. MER 180]MCM3291104.1 Ger(x)C family spore germination protein [Paenibacillus sp. MER 180]
MKINQKSLLYSGNTEKRGESMGLRKDSRNIVRLVVLCWLWIILAGCWDRTEIEQLSIILAAGLDKDGDGDVKMTLLVYIPKEGGGGGTTPGDSKKNGGGGTTTVFSAKAKTLGEAVFKLQNKMPRYIFWGQTEVYVISKKLAEEGLLKHFDFFLRYQNPRENALLFIADGKASEVLKSLPQLHHDVAELFKDLGKSRSVWNVTLLDYMKMMAGDSTMAFAPYAEWKESELGIQAPSIEKLAVFKKDRYIGEIGGQDMIGVMWLRGEQKRLTVSFCKEGDSKDCLSLRVHRNSITFDPYWDGKQLTMRVKLVAFLDMIQNNTKLDVSDADQTKQVESKTEANIEHLIKQSIKTTQQRLNTDVLGFASRIHRKYPAQWKKQIRSNWEKIYADMRTEVRVHAVIERPGSITSTIEQKAGVQ